ncbi:hypothetical protein L7F22_066833 [Adiantum nelumboides]|nr:hypothetical protein [Adiantum nelumboides]
MMAARAAAASSAARSRSRIVAWLKAQLEREWEGLRAEVLYSWFEYLRQSWWEEEADPKKPFFEGETLCFEEYVTLPTSSSSPFTSPLGQLMRAHDMMSKRQAFEGERRFCGICLDEKRGGKCWRLKTCSHIFCQACLGDYLSSMIREGYHRQASACPDPECVKARVAAEREVAEASLLDKPAVRAQCDGGGAISDEELLDFVGQDLVDRLNDLREKASAASDPSAGYCPRPGCERIVRGDPRDVGTVYEPMRSCACGFVYCNYCNKAWHGRNPCTFLASSALVQAYVATQPGSAARLQMESRYGRSNLERMVRTHEEESANAAWLDKRTQQCPHCNVRIEKSMGCNHVECRHCHTHLCYRCGTRLNPREPYRHFNTLGTSCYQKLFDGELGRPEDGFVQGGDREGAAEEEEWLNPLDLIDEDELAAWEAENF